MITILLAEDDKNIRFLIEQKLALEGYATTSVEDGEQVIEELKKGLPDLLLLDIDMPKKNGLEALQEIRANDEWSSLPVIIISNSGSPIEVYQFEKLGVKDYLVKVDFNPDELLALIRKYLEHV